MLKLIAFISMLIDHICNGNLVNQLSLMNAFGLDIRSSSYASVALDFIGRLAFPIFAVMVAEGCRRTRNIWNYALRLLIFAIISEMPYDLLLDPLNASGVTQWRITPVSDMNVLFTFTLAVAGIGAYKWICVRGWSAWLGLIPCAAAVAIGQWFGVDYVGFGVLIVILAYAIDNRPLRFAAIFLTLSVLYLGYGSFWFANLGRYHFIRLLAATIGLALVMFCYNPDKRGPRMKWSFYIAYPAHLLILYLIRCAVIA